MNAMPAKSFSASPAEQADRLHDASDQLDAMTAKWREREGELRGEALAMPPPDDVLVTMTWQRGDECGGSVAYMSMPWVAQTLLEMQSGETQ